MRDPRWSPAQIPLVLRPGALSPPRTLFLHFFDLHFLEEKGAVARSVRAKAEMELAVRFAVMVSARILVPAASYYENDVAAEILRPFLRATGVGSLFSLVGGGSSLAEFSFEKRDQYRPGSRQHTAYASEREQDAAWKRRTRSATRDIAHGWNVEALVEASAEALSRLRTGGASDKDLRRSWADVPERLGREAFIVEHVTPLLPVLTQNPVVTNRLHRIINGLYFQSHADDFGAAVFQNMILLGDDVVSSGKSREDVDFAELLRACRRLSVLAAIMDADIDDLERLSFDPKFQEAFALSQSRAAEPVGPAPDAQSVDLAIVTALPKEREAVELVFGLGRVIRRPDDPHLYKLIECDLGGRKRRIVVATLSEMGNVRAGVTATDLYRSFRPNLVVMVGIAGGCPHPTDPRTHVRLGDVVVGSAVIEYDHRKQLAEAQEFRDSAQRLSYLWRQTAAQLTSEVTGFDTGWSKWRDMALARLPEGPPQLPAGDVLHSASGGLIAHPFDRRRLEVGAIVHVGVIAAGDTLLKDPAYRDLLRSQHNARAVEMESAGLRDAAWSRSAEIGVVRGVVDYCDGFKADEWHLTAAISAAAVTRLIFETMLSANYQSTFDQDPLSGPNGDAASA